MRTLLALLLTLFLLACGGDDDGGEADAGSNADGGSPSADASDDGGGQADAATGDAGAGADAGVLEGGATVTGEIDDQEFEIEPPRGAWYAQDPGELAFVLAMPESGASCVLGGGGQGTNVLIEFPCGAAEVLTYPIDPDTGTECDPDVPHVRVLVEGVNGLEYVAASGSVDLALVDQTAVVGDFTADFAADGALSGSFDAIICSD